MCSDLRNMKECSCSRSILYNSLPQFLFTMFLARISFELKHLIVYECNATFEEDCVTPEKETGLIYQMIFINYFASINTGLKEIFIAKKILTLVY